MPKVNEGEMEWRTTDEGRTRFRRKRLAAAAGGEELGASLYELPPGERAWPYHYHTANEEALYCLAGAGTLRLAGETVTLEAGDYVALPADERGGHHVANDGDEPLRYLAISTMTEPDVIVYPDTDKIGVFVGEPPGSEGERPVHGFYRRDDDVGYWEE